MLLIGNKRVIIIGKKRTKRRKRLKKINNVEKERRKKGEERRKKKRIEGKKRKGEGERRGEEGQKKRRGGDRTERKGNVNDFFFLLFYLKRQIKLIFECRILKVKEKLVKMKVWILQEDKIWLLLRQAQELVCYIQIENKKKLRKERSFFFQFFLFNFFFRFFLFIFYFFNSFFY